MKTIFLLCASILATYCVFTAISLIQNRNSVPVEKKKKAHVQSRREIWLQQARVSMTPLQFWIATYACVLISFLILSSASKTPLVAGAISIGAGALPYFFIAKKRNTIAKELMNAWPDALRDISASVSAGQSLSVALHSIARVGPPVIAEHMKRFVSLARTMGYSAALELVRNDMNDATTDRILEVLIIAHERGGRVVKDIIDDLIDSTTEDIALAETIATESIEMKINSRAVVILPWCVLLVLTFTAEVFRNFYQSPTGAAVIAVGALLSAVGVFVLSRMTRTELEPRVFTHMGDQQ